MNCEKCRQPVSECSNSPPLTLESPQSSPPQQVPQLSTTFTGLSCIDKNLYKSNKNENTPFLRIIEQPQNFFRFRYDTEKSGSTHGSLLGRSYIVNKTSKKTHPTVELVNYTGKAVITCSIKYENERNIHKNIYKILEDEQSSKSWPVPKGKCYKVGFPGIGVHTIKKTDLGNLLYKKLSALAENSSIKTADLRSHCDKLVKSIDQNIVRLKFSAHDDTGKEICDPVLSDRIHNKKSAATNALKICRMSMCGGRPSGGDDLFLLVDKVDKNDVKVRFFEEDENGKRVWSAWGVFLPIDVHHQCAIVCRTPRYIDPEISANVTVQVELVRPSNGSTSDPETFTYIADPVHKYKRHVKKRKIATPYSARSNSDFSGGSSDIDQPVIVLLNNHNEHRLESSVPQLAQQPTSESEWGIISSTVDILENALSQALEPQETSPVWGPCHLNIQPYSGIATQTMQNPAELGIAAPQAPPTVTELCIAAPQVPPTVTELCIAAPPTLPCVAERDIAAPLALPLSTEQASKEDLIDSSLFQFIENDLMEYASLFNMSIHDLFQTDVESNHLVGDSGRVKVEASTSSPQTGNATGAAVAGSDENDLHYQGGREEVFVKATGPSEDANNVTSEGARQISQVTGASMDIDCITKQNSANTADGEGVKPKITSMLSTEANKDVVVRDSKRADKETSNSAEASEKADADYPGLFNTEDAAEVKELVRELCDKIRDKKISKSEVAAKLERLFDIRLSNGDTFLHMTLFKSQRSFEALIKMVDSVKMSHLLNYCNNRGETILHLAVIHGTPELVSLLVAKGCEPMARNCEDESTVHYAVRYASAAMLRALLNAAQRAGAPLDLDAVNAERQSALHLCALHGRAVCAALLGARGASGGVRDAAGRTPLHLCAYDARVEVARALLPHVASHVDAVDGGGRTPLAVACARASSPPALDLARALLAAGARAEPAWAAARDQPVLRDLLRPHMPAGHLQDDVKSEPGDNDDDDDDDDDEYESAEDEYNDEAIPESLVLKLGEMGLSDEAESSTNVK